MTSGKTGETIAEYYFKQIGWKMFRHQPRTVIATKKGKTFMLSCRSDGVPDFTGYEIKEIGAESVAFYHACEVKEAHGDTMPASRVRPEQRQWLSQIPAMSAFIAVVWLDGQPVVELFKPIEKGSYKRGEGVKP